MSKKVIFGIHAMWALLFLGAVVAIVYLRSSAFIRGVRPDPRLPRRSCGSSVIRLPERRPSGGLAWSRAHYPEQYVPENMVVTDMKGLDARREERLMDLGGRAYSRQFNAQFSYTDPRLNRPHVRLQYLRRAETFVGKLSCRGLKPNFAYQVKLRGIYADRIAFERIGRLGRWRLPGRGTNYLDSAYDAFPHKALVESYLFFDFFVTDQNGTAEKELYADSTLHVLWNVNYQRAPRAEDSRPVRVLRQGTNPLLYANSKPDLSPQEVFAESEQHALGPCNRPAIGEAFLLPGKYKAEFVLTEESFHGYADCGSWATVMAAPVGFEVLERCRPSPYWSRLAPDGLRLSLARARVENMLRRHCSADLLVGEATNEKPMIAFVEEIVLPSSGRHVLSLELRASGRHLWQLFVDHGEELAERPSYVIETDGASGWQRFELEITSVGSGYIRLLPTATPGPIGVRNVMIGKVLD